MKKDFGVIIFSLVILHVGIAQDFRGLNEADFQRLNSVWIKSGSVSVQVEPIAELFSWGLGKVIPDESIMIDLGAESPFYHEPKAHFDILSIRKKTKATFVLNLKFQSEDNGWKAKRILNMHSDGSIWFEGEGESHLYRKISGASLPLYGQSTDNRVRIRKLPDLEGEILGHLSTGQNVLLLSRTKDTKPIGEMDSYWYKIKTEEDTIGWSYGYFIQIK